MQEAFLSAYKSIHQLHQPAAFPGWFRSIVHSHCHRIARQDYRQIEVLVSDFCAYNTARDIGAPEQDYWISDCLERLPRHESVVVQLFYWEGYSYQEISLRLGLPLSTVRKRLYSARQRIRKMWANEV